MQTPSLAKRIFAVVDSGGRVGERSTGLDKAIPAVFAAMSLVAVVCGCAGVCLLSAAINGGRGAMRLGSERVPSSTETLAHAGATRSVQMDDLGLIAPRIVVDEESLLFGAEGTGCVWRPAEPQGVLWVVTNRHVLGLELGRPRGALPSASVEFPEGARVQPQRIGLVQGVDLAVLEIADDGLAAGTDYLEVSPAMDEEWGALRPAREIAMVGTMLGFKQTRSFGRIGGLRDEALDFWTPAARWIQIDGTILPGNSGGPLLLKHGEAWRWIGVNTLSYEGRIGFAIHTSELFRHPIEWFDAAPSPPDGNE